MLNLNLMGLFFKTDGKLTVNKLALFLRDKLEVNQFEVNGTLRSGNRITVSFIGGSTDPRKAGKVISNSNFAPKS